MKRTTLVIAFAAALGAGTASAQLAPGGPQSGPPDAGDTRQLPDRRDPAPRAADPAYPGAAGSPTDRQPAPYSSDPRYTAPPQSRDYDRSTRRDSNRGTTWRERWFGPREPVQSHTWERGGDYGPYGNGLGSQQYRFDGPGQGGFLPAPWV